MSPSITLVGVGGDEFVAAIAQVLAFLFRVPNFVFHTGGPDFGKPQLCPGFGHAAKDAVAAIQLLAHGDQVDVFAGFVQHLGACDGIDRKAAQATTQVAPQASTYPLSR